MSDTRTIALTVTCHPDSDWTDKDVAGLLAAALFEHSAITVSDVQWVPRTWVKDA